MYHLAYFGCIWQQGSLAAGDCMADQIKWQGGRPTMTFQTKLFLDQGSKGDGVGGFLLPLAPLPPNAQTDLLDVLQT